MWAFLDSNYIDLIVVSVLSILASLLFNLFNALCHYMNNNGVFMSGIPPKLENPGDPQKKFLTAVTISEYLTLQKEAADRGIDLLTLTGSVLSLWVSRGCPLDFSGNDQVSRD